MKTKIFIEIFLFTIFISVIEKSFTQPLSVSITSSTNVSCYGGNDGSATAAGTGGAPPYDYFWSNWQSGPTISNLYAGYYEVTITDDEFSTATTFVIITEPPYLDLAETITDVSCYGGNNGSIALVASGGLPPFLFNWSNGMMGPSISGLTAGTYTVSVTQDNDCITTAIYFVDQPDNLVIDLVELNDEICAGAEDGSITIEVLGGVSPFEVDWSNGSNDLFISDLAPGAYSVTVTDDNNCTETASYIIDPGSILNVTLLQLQDVSCNGGSDGAILILASGNMPPFTYVWSNGMTGSSINGLTAGTYFVTTTDNNECEVVSNYTVNQPTALSVSITQSSQNLCFGDMEVDLSANASGGTPGYTALWSDGTVGFNNNNLDAGTYTVTVTDDNNCTKTATSIVTEPAELIIDLIDLTHETCAGAEDGSITIEAIGGTNPVDIDWSNGENEPYIDDLASGVYSVTISDANGCTETANYSINPGVMINVILQQIQHVSCNGGSNGAISISASGGNFPYTYIWSNGMVGSSISGLNAGTYLVTVTDDNECVVIESYNVNEPLVLSISITQTSQNLCFGDTIADLSASVNGGTPGYAALWSDGTPGLDNPDLGAGLYSITVTDANMCVSSQSAVIGEPTQLTLVVSTTNETASGANNGTATVVPAGGTPAYSYLWSNGDTTSTITGLPPGTYSVTIADMNECTVSGSGQVFAFGCTLDVMPGTINFICEEDTSTITPVLIGATGSVSYLWTDGSTAESLQVSQGGEYCVTVTDAGNCQDVECFVITEIVIPPLTCPVAHESASGANDGSINCDGTPGIVTFSWSNGAMTSSIAGLAPGEYCLTVTDMNGCTRVQCFNIQSGNCQMSVTSVETNISCHGDSTGSIAMTVTGATEPVTYTWSNGASSATIVDLASGNYSVTIADAAGCIDNRSFIITEPLPLTITVDSVAPADHLGSGLIWITVNGGTPLYTYQWLDPAGGNQNTEDLNNLMESGQYSLTVTDAAGCIAISDSIFVDQDVATVSISQFKSLKVYPVPANDVLFMEMDNPITEAIISGADGRLYKKVINPGFNRIDVSDLESGWYVIRISDGDQWYLARMVK